MRPTRRALAFHQRVGRHGGPVDHQVGVAEQLVQGQVVGSGGFPQSGHDALRRVVGCGCGFEEPRLPALARDHKVGEGSAYVYPDLVHLGSS